MLRSVFTFSFITAQEFQDAAFYQVFRQTTEYIYVLSHDGQTLSPPRLS
jgi:hypothetical protein